MRVPGGRRLHVDLLGDGPRRAGVSKLSRTRGREPDPCLEPVRARREHAGGGQAMPPVLEGRLVLRLDAMPFDDSDGLDATAIREGPIEREMSRIDEVVNGVEVRGLRRCRAQAGSAGTSPD
jgi:hypothetical protein